MKSSNQGNSPKFDEVETKVSPSLKSSSFADFLKQNKVKDNLNENINRDYVNKNYEVYKLNRIFNDLTKNSKIAHYNNFQTLIDAFPDLIPQIKKEIADADSRGELENDQDLKNAIGKTDFSSWYNLALAISIKELFDENGDLLPEIYNVLNNNKVFEEHGLDEKKLENKPENLRTKDDKRKAVSEQAKIRILSGFFTNIIGGFLIHKAKEDKTINIGTPIESKDKIASVPHINPYTNILWVISKIPNLYQTQLEGGVNQIDRFFIHSIYQRMRDDLASGVQSKKLADQMQTFLHFNEEVFLGKDLSTLEVMYKFYALLALKNTLDKQDGILKSIQAKGSIEFNDKDQFLKLFNNEDMLKEKSKDGRLELQTIMFNDKYNLSLTHKETAMICGLAFDMNYPTEDRKNPLGKLFTSINYEQEKPENVEAFLFESTILRKYLTEDVAYSILAEIIKECGGVKECFNDLEPTVLFKKKIEERFLRAKHEFDSLEKKGLLNLIRTTGYENEFVITDSISFKKLTQDLLYSLNKNIKLSQGLDRTRLKLFNENIKKEIATISDLNPNRTFYTQISNKYASYLSYFNERKALLSKLDKPESFLKNQAKKILIETDKEAARTSIDIDLNKLSNILKETNDLISKPNHQLQNFLKLEREVAAIPQGRKIVGAMLGLFGVLIIGTSIAVGVASLGILSPLAALGIVVGGSLTASAGTGLGMSYFFRKSDLNRTMQEMSRMKANEQNQTKPSIK